MKALIGYFDLDPNRAIALALQAFAAQPGNASYLQLFSLFVPEAVTQTLGFLFQHAAADGAETPSSLFAVAVALIKVRTKPWKEMPYLQQSYVHFVLLRCVGFCTKLQPLLDESNQEQCAFISSIPRGPFPCKSLPWQR